VELLAVIDAKQESVRVIFDLEDTMRRCGLVLIAARTMAAKGRDVA